MNLHDTLLAYSEWLDGEGLMASPRGDDPNDDKGEALRRDESHEDLVKDFFRHWYSNPDRAPLVGDDEDGESSIVSRIETALKTLEEIMTSSNVETHIRLQAASTVLGYVQSVGGED